MKCYTKTNEKKKKFQINNVNFFVTLPPPPLMFNVFDEHH